MSNDTESQSQTPNHAETLKSHGRDESHAAIHHCDPAEYNDVMSTRKGVSSGQSALRRPCDQCRRRKVRCDRASPCERCLESRLACTHETVRSPPGPKKGNGRVLSQLRAESNTAQDRTDPTTQKDAEQRLFYAPSASLIESLVGSSSWDGSHSIPTAAPNLPQMASQERFVAFHEFAHAALASTSYTDVQVAGKSPPSDLAKRNGVLQGSTTEVGSTTTAGDSSSSSGSVCVDERPVFPADWTSMSFEIKRFMHRCIDLFFVNLYPIYPLFDRTSFCRHLEDTTDPSVLEKVLVIVLCALTVVHVSGWPDLSFDSRAALGRRLVRQCLKLRLECDHIESVSTSGILTSLFLSVTYFELRHRRSSWFYLREAITLAQAAHLHEEVGYQGLNDVQKICYHRTYCLLFITERGAAILGNFPVSITRVPQMPTHSLSGEGNGILTGLQSLFRLFSFLDEGFIEFWNSPVNALPQVMKSVNFKLIQQNLEDFRYEGDGLSHIQRADIVITQHWLRLVFWQAAMRQGLISSSARDSAFSYTFPIEIARSLCDDLKTLPSAAIQVHGLGIVRSLCLSDESVVLRRTMEC